MNLLNSIADVLLPRFCKVCGRRLTVGELHLCAVCTLKMPVLQYKKGEISATEQRLLGVRSLVRAASYMQYDKESGYRKIMYHLKYYGHPDVGRFLAHRAAETLQAEGFFDGMDFILPVPLSRRKYRKRGYNQSDSIAAGIAEVTGLPVRKDVAVRRISNQVQARKGQLQRWGNAEGIFRVDNADALEGSHVLVVDDILTSGATLTSLTDVMEKAAPSVRVSVFALGLTD